MKKPLKIFLIIITVLLAMVLATAILLQTYDAFGAYDNNKVKNAYENRADNYYDGRFHNELELPESKINETDPYSSRSTGKGTVPEDNIPMMRPSYENCSGDDIEITWYGHSTLLIQMDGMNLLFDPVFSDYVGLNKALGTPRFNSIHSMVNDIPHIDFCILTHDHFDHMDYSSIMELDDRIDTYIAPIGADKRLEQFGISDGRIINMSWWEEQQINGLTVACTPAQHSSGRILIDKRKSLWCSYVIYDENHRIFLTGDTGFGPHFEEIHQKYGDMDFVLTDGAQYGGKKDQRVNHMFPEESAKAVSILGAKTAMLIHWGSFNLSDSHAWDDPPSRFAIACDENSIDAISPLIGQTFRLSNTRSLHNHWWEQLE